MYVAPNSTIKFLSSVPLDPTFEHTLYFTSRQIQETIIGSYAAHTLDQQSYVRESDGVLRVSLSTAQLYNCNYIMFKNTSFENRWFYAFITAIHYRANGTSVVEFQLDPIQTWFFDFHVEPSFIEREHSETDEPGDNLVPENLEHGDYMSTSYSRMISGALGDFPTMCVVFACTFGYDSTGNTPAEKFPDYTGGTNNGVFSGLALHKFTSAAAAVAFVDAVVEAKKLAGIVCCYMMFDDFFQHDADPVFSPNLQSHPYTVASSKPTSFPGMNYTVKNKKLLTYPYSFLYVTDNQGTGVAFPYEYFSGDAVRFDCWGTTGPDPAVIALPFNYKNVVGGNWDEKMILKGFPNCAFNVDAFKAWLAQNGSSLAVSNMSAGLSAAIGVAAGNPAAVLGYVGSVAQTVQQMYIHSVQPPQSHGNVSGNALYSAGLLNFSYCRKYIRPEFVRIIDDYFNRFGYATHRVKVPNVFTNFGNRPHWCFLQTRRCGLKGNVPSDDLRDIQNIFDAGITFWKVAAEVGDYSLNNAPTV